MENQITITLTHKEAAMIVGTLNGTGRRDCAHLADKFLLQCLKEIDKEVAKNWGGIALWPRSNQHPSMRNRQKIESGTEV
ncbi:hypothetical protein [Pontibacter brevis]